MWNEAPPVFRARNGELYTQQEFSDWYRHPSSAAKPPGAPPAHLASLAIPDTSSPGPVQADGTAQPARMPPPGLGSAVKPAAPPAAPAGHLAPAPKDAPPSLSAPPPQPQDMWSQSHFIRVLLPARVALRIAVAGRAARSRACPPVAGQGVVGGGAAEGIDENKGRASTVRRRRPRNLSLPFQACESHQCAHS